MAFQGERSESGEELGRKGKVQNSKSTKNISAARALEQVKQIKSEANLDVDDRLEDMGEDLEEKLLAAPVE